MGLETATLIHELVSTNPVGASDPKSQGDDHIRLIKATLQNTFANVDGAVTASHTELNYVDGVTSAIQTQLDSKANAAALNASNLTSGTVPDARFPATLPAVSGANLTALNATNLGSGTVPDARFPATLPASSGANLTNLNASNLATGTVNAARLPITLAAGTFTPTLTNTLNIDSTTPQQCQYLRVGNTVTVSGIILVNPTAAGDTQVGMSLPVASDLNISENLGGAGVWFGLGSFVPVRFIGDSVNNRADINFTATDGNSRALTFSFTYLVI